MINLKELQELLDKATHGEWHFFEMKMEDAWNIANNETYEVAESLDEGDAKFLTAIKNNAKELLRLAKIGQQTEEESK